MIDQLKDLVKAAKTKKEALGVIHVEAQNVKIQLYNKGYRILTNPGPPGPDFDEVFDETQAIQPGDETLIEYFKTVRALKKVLDKNQGDVHIPSNLSEREFVEIIERKAE